MNPIPQLPMTQLPMPPMEEAEREMEVAAWLLRQPAGVEGAMVGDDLQSLGSGFERP